MWEKREQKSSHQIESALVSILLLPLPITAAAACLAEQRFGRAGQAREKAGATHQKKSEQRGERQEGEKERRNCLLFPKEEKERVSTRPTATLSSFLDDDKKKKEKKKSNASSDGCGSQGGGGGARLRSRLLEQIQLSCRLLSASVTRRAEGSRGPGDGRSDAVVSGSGGGDDDDSPHPRAAPPVSTGRNEAIPHSSSDA